MSLLYWCGFVKWFNFYWCFFEAFVILLTLFVFFKDPKRRWNFFGYRPTAVMGLVDPDTGEILMIKKVKELWWGFCQGGIYGNNIYDSIAQILKREVGLTNSQEDDLYQFRYKIPLGRIKIAGYRMKRATLDTISIRKKPIGKGYIGCIIYTNLQGIKDRLRPGYGIDKIAIFPIDKVRQLIKYETDENTPAKIRLLGKLLDDIEQDMDEKKQHDIDQMGADDPNGNIRKEIESIVESEPQESQEDEKSDSHDQNTDDSEK